MSPRRLVLGVLAALALAGAPAAHAAGGVEITAGRTLTLDAAALQASPDVVDVTYVIDGAPQTITGVSLRQALLAAGIDPDTPSAITVRGAGGARLQLTAPDYAAAPAFAEGPVVLWVDEAGVTRLLRPATASEAARVIASAPNQPLQLEPVDVTLVDVGILTPSDGETRKVGERIQFAALATDAGAASLTTWRWTFGDGTSASGRDARHVYREPGRYRVTVTASDGGSVGGSASLLLVIEGDEDDEQDDGPRRDGREGAGGGGGTAGGGSGGVGGGTGAGGAGAGGGYGGGAGTASAPAPSTSSSPAPAASPEPTPPRKRAKRDRAPAPDAADDEPTVEGILLTDSAAPAPAPAAQAAGLIPSATADDGDGLDVPWVSLAIVLSFFSGLQAARVQRARWAPRRRR